MEMEMEMHAWRMGLLLHASLRLPPSSPPSLVGITWRVRWDFRAGRGIGIVRYKRTLVLCMTDSGTMGLSWSSRSVDMVASFEGFSGRESVCEGVDGGEWGFWFLEVLRYCNCLSVHLVGDVVSERNAVRGSDQQISK